jgi:hypothetical protein
MTLAEALDLMALPCGLVATAAFSWVCIHLATYLRTKTHNERLARIVDGAGRVAGDIADRLNDLPAGSNLQTVKEKAISTGISDLRDTFAPTIAKLGGASNGELSRIIRDALQEDLKPVAPSVVVTTPTATIQGVQP